MIPVENLIGVINKIASKFPEATIESYNVGFKTDVGTIYVGSPYVPPAPAPAEKVAPAGEAPAAPSGKKPRASRAPAADTKTATPPATPAAEEDLFGNAGTATAAGSSTPKETSASASAEDDLFGEKPAAKEEPKPKATIEQLRKALVDCQTKHGHKDHALGVLKKFTRDGNPTISSLDEAKYQDVIDACAKYVPTK